LSILGHALRELYGFSHPDEANVFSADAGRGVEIVFFGVPPRLAASAARLSRRHVLQEWRAAGYVETLSLFIAPRWDSICTTHSAKANPRGSTPGCCTCSTRCWE